MGRPSAPWSPSFCARAASLPPSVVMQEMRSFAGAKSFNAMLKDLVRGAPLEGARLGSLAKPLVIGWWRLDRMCFPQQAARALMHFPDARMH